MRNNSAQSSAPFEVLIAVIIMSFVLVMAFQAISFLMEEQCKSQLREQATNLKAKVEEAVRGNSVLLKFFPPKCFEREETKMKLEVVSSSSRCSIICGKAQEECLFFTYRSSDFSYDLCLDNSPTYTTFLTGSPCSPVDGFTLEDFRSPTPSENAVGEAMESIPRGIYNLQNVTGSSETVPKICAYRKSGS